MMSFPSERSFYEHQSALLREAETRRLLKQSRAEGKPHCGFVARLLDLFYNPKCTLQSMIYRTESPRMANS